MYGETRHYADITLTLFFPGAPFHLPPPNPGSDIFFYYYYYPNRSEKNVLRVNGDEGDKKKKRYLQSRGGSSNTRERHSAVECDCRTGVNVEGNTTERTKNRHRNAYVRY